MVLKFVLLLSLWASISAIHSPELRVYLTNNSPVLGQYMTSHGGHGIRAFRNIPYAEPPVGQLRFADPVPKAAWTEELSIPNDIIMCPQEEVFFFDGQYLGQEDCLYLNVYVPMHPKSRDPLPVMFFIHGGGFSSGSGSSNLYSPEFLLEEDVILVVGNYRLSALGFLSTFTEEFPGNYGLKDQVLQMKWIKENIAKFGGDPQRVTIFGESAGAGSVGYHLLSPMSKPLFQGAILQSGTPYETWANISQAQSLGFAEHMFKHMGCEYSRGDYKKALQCLREKESSEFVAKMKEFMVWGHHPVVVFAPVKEVNSKSPFITVQDYTSAQVIGNDVPVMLGVTANEGAFITAMLAANEEILPEFEKNFDNIIASFTYLYDRFDKETWPEKLAMMKEHYFNGENFSWATKKRGMNDLSTDIIFFTGLEKMLTQRVTAAQSTFVYKFNYRGSTSFTDIPLRKSKEEVNFGVSHIDDLLYLFPMVKNVLKTRVMSDEDHKMRKQMVKMWVNFATHRNPSSKHVNWTPITKLPIDYMRIGDCNLDVCNAGTKTQCAMESGLFEEKFTFLDKLFHGVAGQTKEEL